MLEYNNDLDKYIDKLEKEIKFAIEIHNTNLLPKEAEKQSISEFLHGLIYSIFEEDEDKLENLDEKDFIVHAIKLAKEFIKYKQHQKETIFSINLAFLIITEFEKNRTINKEFDEMHLLASTCFLTIINKLKEEELEQNFPELPIKKIKIIDAKESIEKDLLLGKHLPFSSFLFSLVFIFEHLPDVDISWKDFEKLPTFSNKHFNVEDIWGY